MDLVNSFLLHRDVSEHQSEHCLKREEIRDNKEIKDRSQWRNLLKSLDSPNGPAGGKERRSKCRTQSVMEFMYCIPDLEVFIDKTIKKCLLEYDLDAKDTEDVLDDMEKTWPDSPNARPHPPQQQQQQRQQLEKNGVDGVTENGTLDLHTKRSTASLPESLLQKPKGASVDDASFGKEKLRKSRSSDDILTARNGAQSSKGDKLFNYDDEHVSPPKKTRLAADDALPSKTFESDSKSSPLHLSNKQHNDGDMEGQPRSEASTPDGHRSPASRHAKLKSRLQQRYMEDKKDSPMPAIVQTRRSTTSRDSPRESPLARELISDDSYELARGNLDLLARAVNLHKLQATKEVQPLTREEMPQLVRQTSIPTSPPRLERVISIEGRETTRKLEDYSPSRGCPTLYPTGPLPSKHHPQHQGRMYEDGPRHHNPEFQRKAMLLQQYQNEYHSSNSMDSVGVRKDLRSSPDTERLAHLAINRQLSQGARGDILSTRLRLSPQDIVHGQAQDISRPHKPRLPEEEDRYSPQSHSYHPAQLDIRSHTRMHRSRIASIIAEELQKDDECGPTQNSENNANHYHRQNIPYITRITSEESGPEAQRVRRRSRPTSYHQSHSSPATFDLGNAKQHGDPANDKVQSRVLTSPIPTRLSQTEIKGLTATALSMNVPNFLPSHPSLLSSHSNGRVALPAHLAPSAILPHITVQSFLAGPIAAEAVRAECDDQPEDLSMKPRKRTIEQREGFRGDPARLSPAMSLHYSDQDRLRIRHEPPRGSFSTPTSPENARVIRKSASPSNYSDREVDYRAHNTELPLNSIKTSGLWEKRGHDFDFAMAAPIDTKLLVDKRRIGFAANNWSNV